MESQSVSFVAKRTGSCSSSIRKRRPLAVRLLAPTSYASVTPAEVPSERLMFNGVTGYDLIGPASLDNGEMREKAH